MHCFSQLPYSVDDAIGNMATDAALFGACCDANSVGLRFYGWDSAALTFGYSQKVREIDNLPAVPQSRIRRQSGGGIVLHGTDLTYALCLPIQHPWAQLRAVETYKVLHITLQDALSKLGLKTRLAPCPGPCLNRPSEPSRCFDSPQLHDLILFDGRKVAGAAMRRTGSGLMIQGSLQLSGVLDSETVQSLLSTHLQTQLQTKDPVRRLLSKEQIESWKIRFSDPRWNNRR